MPGAIRISRGSPRFCKSKRIPVYKTLMPIKGESLDDFREYLEKLDANQVFKDLHDIVDNYEPILLCFEHDRSICHRGIIAQWFEKHLGIVVKEFEIGE
jgi:uncharacterized protein (DUF488 family)